MTVKVLSLGSNWWTRFGRDDADPHTFRSNTAYYNSTGVRCGRKVRRHWVVPGLVRFNGVGDVNPGHPNRAIGRTFVCSDLTHACGGNRLLVKSYAGRAVIPDCYLIVVAGRIHGRIDFTSPAWKSLLCPVIAASCLRDQQEAMLLMTPGDWLKTAQGFWMLSQRKRGEVPRLVRIGDSVSA